MNLLVSFFFGTWAQRLGWVLIHFLWEGTIIALILAALLRLLTKASSHTRYALAGVALLICAIAPVVTWAMLVAHEGGSSPITEIGLGNSPQAQDGVSSASTALPTSLQVHVETVTPWQVRVFQAANASLPYSVGLWFVGVVVLSTRLTLGWIWMKRLCHSSIPARDPRCLAKFESLLTRLRIARPVRLLESALVEVPMLIGWLRPTILIPVSLFIGMTPDQLEAVFAHELAHVRRYDYLVNLFQTVIETILFYHPAIWWISRKLREERENSCDDLALEVMEDRLVYVSALAQLEEGRTTVLALSARGGLLLHRIKRIVGVTDKKISAWPLWLLIAGLLTIACITKTRATEALAKPEKDASATQSAAASPKNSALTKALAAAASKGDLAEVESLLKQGANPNANQDPDGRNALFAAAVGNQVETVKLLLQNGADPNCKNQCGNKLIDWVLDQGHLDMATVLRDAGAKISPQAWAGATGDLAALESLIKSGVIEKGHTDTAMKFAVSMGHLDAVKFLEGVEGKPVAGKFLAQAAKSGNIPMMQYIVNRGANIKTDGGDAMDQAVIFYNQVEAVKFLLAHGADPNRLSRWQQYTLAEATSAAMVKVLLDGGANPNVEDIFGTPLSMAPDAESVRLLVQHRANLRPKLNNGNTLIESVISRGLYDKADVIDELIKHGAEFDPQGNGAGALARAAAGNQIRTMKVLLDRGVSANAYSDEPRMRTSVLHNATENSASDAVKLLLARGANPIGDPRDEFTPLSMALMCGHWESADLLRKAGADDVGELSSASALGDVTKVSDLLKNGANINETDHTGDTPFFYAVRRGQVEVARLLLEQGANINIFDSIGMTAKSNFDLQVSSGNPMQAQMDWDVSQEEGLRRTAAFKELFAKYPSNPNYRNSQGRTALHQLAFSGSTMIDLLTTDKTHPADPNLQDRDGNTPLLLAALSPRAKEIFTQISTPENDKTPNAKMKDWNAVAYVAYQLIKAGARLDLVVTNGKTVGELAMEAAVKANNLQLLSVLRDAGVVDDGPASKTTEASSEIKYKALTGSLVDAAKGDDLAEVERLLEQGADPNAALLPAAQCDNLEVVKLLLRNGADPNKEEILLVYGGAPLEKSVPFILRGKTVSVLPLEELSIRDQDYEAAKLLVEHGAKTDLPMLVALHAGCGEFVKLYWEHGARNITELCYAISQGGSVADLQKLLDKGSPVIGPKDEKMTALADAAMLGRMDVVQFLVQHGADVNEGGYLKPQNPDYVLKPMVMAASEGQDEIIEYLLQHGGRPEPVALWMAGYNSSPHADQQRPSEHFEKCVRILLDSGALKHATPEEEGRIIYAPIGTRSGPANTTVLKMLLDAGANPEAPFLDGEKPSSVIGYVRDLYQKNKNDPAQGQRASEIKPLLDMLEAANKGSAPRTTGTVAPTI